MCSVIEKSFLYNCNSCTLQTKHSIPVHSTFLVSVFVQHHDVDYLVDGGRDLTLLDAAQSGVHVERLATSHLVDQRVKLGAVAEILLYLRNECRMP